MIMMFPFLLITLHLSQMGFTDDLTFMVKPPFISLNRLLLSGQIRHRPAPDPGFRRPAAPLLSVPGVFTAYGHILERKKGTEKKPSRKVRLVLYHPVVKIASTLFISPGNSAFGQIVRRQLDPHLVSRKNTDKIHAESSADVREHHMFVDQFHLEHRVGKFLKYGAFYFNDI